MTRKRRTTHQKRRNSRTVRQWMTHHRNRRSKMHPTRRKQENLGIIAAVASIPLIIIGSTVAVIAACITIPVAVLASLSSRGTPPDNTHKKRRKVEVHQGLPRGGFFSGIDARRAKKRASSCRDDCKYSTHHKSTCDCVCGGSSHGIWAWKGGNRTMPTAGPDSKRKLPTERKKRPTQRKRPTTRKRTGTKT